MSVNDKPPVIEDIPKRSEQGRGLVEILLPVVVIISYAIYHNACRETEAQNSSDTQQETNATSKLNSDNNP